MWPFRLMAATWPISPVRWVTRRPTFEASATGSRECIAELPLQSPQPFFSPDSQWVAFFDAGKLKKVAVGGGVPNDARRCANSARGTWGTDGSIVFRAHLQGRADVATGDGRSRAGADDAGRDARRDVASNPCVCS